MALDFTLIEKMTLGIALFTGFIWLRRRKRLIAVEENTTPLLLGIFGVLPVLLIAEVKLAPLIPIGPAGGIVLRLLGIAMAFWVVGHYFVNPKRAAPPIPAEEKP